MSKVIFKLQPTPTFTVPVEIPRHGEEPAKIKITFKHKTRDEMQEFMERAGTSDASQDVALVNEMIAGWEGPDMPFGDEAIALLIQNYQGAVPALVQAYSLEILQARRKN
ncbi:phage tail assembly chaperone [Achromobacter aegrifaciens]|uniref:phage tail assembly chaperone n=1 Tax=Achromobacter aegrifaciens TaxID=1287736 RepID=UPI000F73FE51|nr:phage tail assembly chaperone [Achromobacter aegrifaciens]RSE91442.1 hypothetical protein EGU54_30795 [Achromobacter aegrifaciens]